MDLWQAFETRTTVRAFLDREVPLELLHRAVQAALHAPSYNHLWEWAFIRVNDASARQRLVIEALKLRDWRNRDELQRTFGHLPKAAREVYLAACPMQRTMMLRAPELLVVTYRTKVHEGSARHPADLNAHASIWMGIAHMLLSLAAEGLFSCTVPPGPTVEAKKVLDLPADWEIATLLPIGYPRSRPRRRAHPTDPLPFIHNGSFQGFTLPTTDEQMD